MGDISMERTSEEEGLPQEGAEPSAEDTFREQAVRAYMQTGSLAKTAKVLGTTVYEVSKIARTQAWAEEVANARRTELAVLDTALSSILDKATLELIHRLEYGEEVYDAVGNCHLKPVSAASLTKMIGTIFDKRQLLRGLPTALNNESSKLSELAEKLEQLGRYQSAKTIDADEGGAAPRLENDA
jgi:hypothetical protein